MAYWLGIDAGGSRSTLVCTDDNLRECFRNDGDGIQAKRLSKNELTERIFSLLTPFLEKHAATDIGGIGIGLAGAGRTNDQQSITKALSMHDNRYNYHVASDAKIGHIGAFNNGDGILVITGTGSLVLGRKANTWSRAGGYGYILGDESSGYMLGLLGLRSVGNMFDGGPPTILFEYLRDEFHPSITNRDQLIDRVYSEGFSPAEVAPFVLQAARQGDAVCLEIISRQAYALADETRLVWGRLDYSNPSIVIMGGLGNDEWYHQNLLTALKDTVPGAQFIQPAMEPAVGACMMAMNSHES